MGLSYIREAGKSGKLGLWHITESVDELLKMREFSKEDLKEAVSNLSTKEDFNNLLTAVDAYGINKARGCLFVKLWNLQIN